MNKAILTLSILVASVSAFAQAQKKAEPKKVECPIMKGHKVDVATATKNKLFTDYKGRRYYFCCAGCPSVFKKDPAKFASRPSLPTPATKKPAKKAA